MLIKYFDFFIRCLATACSDESIYFCRQNEEQTKGASGNSDIYFSEYRNGRYNEPKILDSMINSEFAETEPVIAPDNSYLIFISNRPGGFSKMMNLYVSFKDTKGNWSKAKCLSHYLKIDNICFPSISYDGKYLFFCGGYPTKSGYSNSSYYWISANVIQNFR